MKRILALCMSLVLTIGLFAGCGTNGDTLDTSPSDSTSVSADKDKNGLTIGYANLADSDVWCFTMMDKFTNVMEELGNTVIQADAEASVETQLNQIDNFISMGCDVIVTVACDGDGLVPAAESCYAAGIPLISIASKISSDKAIFVGWDNYEVGVNQANLLAELLPEDGTYCYMRGTAGMENTEKRMNGFVETIEELRPDAKRLDLQDGDNNTADAMTVAESWMQAYPDVDAIIASNDQMAMGIVQACKSAGKTLEDFPIIMGCDGDYDACVAITDGYIEMTVMNPAIDIANLTWDTICELQAGASVDDYAGKDLLITPISLTVENVEEYAEVNVSSATNK